MCSFCTVSVSESVSGALFVALSASRGTVLRAQTIPVQLWITTSSTTVGTAGLKQHPDVRFAPDASHNAGAIEVDDRKTFQKVEGGGAYLTTKAQPFKIRWHLRVFRYTLLVRTSVTFQWSGAFASAKMHTGSEHDKPATSGQEIQ
ncbi:MAG TPA: hypothetical protein VK699_10695 [Terriglobales bacterium]|nr:hypothetical protein [Terriglobales bacterium]